MPTITKPTAKPTFADLCRRQPQLAWLAEEAASIVDDGSGPSFCGNAAWYGHGAFRGRPSLRSRTLAVIGKLMPDGRHNAHLYDTAYEGVYDRLPDCRGNCGCVWRDGR